MSKFQKIIIAICLLVIVVLGAAIVFVFTTTSEAIKICGTFTDISKATGDLDYDALPHTEISVDAEITKNAFAVIGAEGTVKIGDTEYKLSSASSDSSNIYLRSKNDAGYFDVTIQLAKGTESAVISVLPSQTGSDNSMWAGPASDEKSLDSILKEQNIVNYSDTKLLKEINLSGSFTDIYGEYSVDMYDELPHREVSINAKVKVNAYGREYAEGSVVIEGKEYTINYLSRDNSYGKNRLFLTCNDFEKTRMLVMIQTIDTSQHISIQVTNYEGDTVKIHYLLIGLTKDKNEFEQALKELSYI